MNRDVIVTCAVTGAGDTVGRHPAIPVTPEAIALSAIEAAKAGATVVHCHVREPDGQPSRKLEYYAEVVERIRDSDTDVVLNLTAGMGGDLVLGGGETPLPPEPEGTDMAGPLTRLAHVEQPLPPAEAGTDMAGASERLAHVAQILPEICTLDCGTMNFGEGDYIMTNTPAMLKAMARQVQALGVRPEIEAFDTGHVLLAKWLKDQGLIDDPVMIQLCMGIPWGAPDDIATLLAMKANMPEDWVFSAFSIGRNQLPYVAMAVLAGGNIRVGLEDNIWLDKGVLATNGQLVERAATIADAMGSRVMGPQEVRDRLKLQKRW